MASITFRYTSGPYNVGETAGEGVGLTRAQMEELVQRGIAEWTSKRQAPVRTVPENTVTKGQSDDPLSESTGARSRGSTQAQQSPLRRRGRPSRSSSSSTSGGDAG